MYETNHVQKSYTDLCGRRERQFDAKQQKKKKKNKKPNEYMI